jgi:hypothetical protein
MKKGRFIHEFYQLFEEYANEWSALVYVNWDEIKRRFCFSVPLVSSVWIDREWVLAGTGIDASNKMPQRKEPGSPWPVHDPVQAKTEV